MKIKITYLPGEEKWAYLITAFVKGLRPSAKVKGCRVLRHPSTPENSGEWPRNSGATPERKAGKKP